MQFAVRLLHFAYRKSNSWVYGITTALAVTSHYRIGKAFWFHEINFCFLTFSNNCTKSATLVFFLLCGKVMSTKLWAYSVLRGA